MVDDLASVSQVVQVVAAIEASIAEHVIKLEIAHMIDYDIFVALHPFASLLTAAHRRPTCVCARVCVSTENLAL